jgi:glycoprotein endo-alpha-1,2-mannosidase
MAAAHTEAMGKRQKGRSMRPPRVPAVFRLGRRRPIVAAAAALLAAAWAAGAAAHRAGVPREVLAFYYGWYGNPAVSGRWVHWQGVDAAQQQIANATDYPVMGAYDSHDPALVARQAVWAHAAGITGFIASWWGRGDFTDRSLPLLLAAAYREGLAVSAYYETIHADTPSARQAAAVADLDYLIRRYGGAPAWLRVAGKPVVFVYARALLALSPPQWRTVLARVRHDNPGGALFIADSLAPAYVAVFDGASTYNITDQTRHLSPAQAGAWARAAYPRMTAAAGPGKIATVTVIPGYDDSKTGRPPPRPITFRYGGETYDALWRQALRAAPDWVLITSWNEWHEGSELEPSVQYGARILDDTTAFARSFLSLPPGGKDAR